MNERNRLIAELSAEALHAKRVVNPSIFHGAPSHSAAHLLNALSEQGWKLIRA